jgi:hypothetical protein
MSCSYVSKIGHRATRVTFAAGQLRQTQRSRQTRVSRSAISQHNKVLRTSRSLNSDFATEHCWQAHCSRRLSKTYDAVQTVVIGHGQRGQTQSVRFFGQLFWVRCPIEKRKV